MFNLYLFTSFRQFTHSRLFVHPVDLCLPPHFAQAISFLHWVDMCEYPQQLKQRLIWICRTSLHLLNPTYALPLFIIFSNVLLSTSKITSISPIFEYFFFITFFNTMEASRLFSHRFRDTNSSTNMLSSMSLTTFRIFTRGLKMLGNITSYLSPNFSSTICFTFIVEELVWQLITIPPPFTFDTPHASMSL